MTNTQFAVSQSRANGVAMADYDVAVFQVTVTERGKNAVLAKESLKESIAKVLDVITALKEKGLTFRDDSYKTSSSVQPHTIYDSKKSEWKMSGQKAVWGVTFQTANMDLVNDVYDELTSVELTEIYVAPPAFKVIKIDDLQKSALEDAWAKVKDQFAAECRVFGLAVSDYEVYTWNIHYDNNESADPRRMMMAQAAPMGGADESIDLNPGKSVINVNLTVNWAKKL